MRIAIEAQTTFKMTAGGGPTAYPLAWHESMRYFRISQITTDMFDAFRNLYLALESLLSHIAPVRLRPNGRPDEGEGQWAKRALQAASVLLQGHNSAMTFGRYLPAPGSADEVAADVTLRSDSPCRPVARSSSTLCALYAAEAVILGSGRSCIIMRTWAVGVMPEATGAGPGDTLDHVLDAH